MRFCDECGEPISDSASRSPFSGRYLCWDCAELCDEDEPSMDLEDRLDAALRDSPHDQTEKK